MRLMRIVGFAAVAAIVATALVGAGSASAVTLCKVEALEECPEASRYPVGQEIHAVLQPGTKMILEAGPITDECEESLMKGKTIVNNGETLLGQIETATVGKCTCKTTTLIHTPWATHLLGHGVMHVDAEILGGRPGILVICKDPFGTEHHCIYETESALITVLGGALIDVKVELRPTGLEGDFTCIFGSNALWKASYEVLTPKPLYVSLKP